MASELEVAQRIIEGNGLSVASILYVAWRIVRRLDRIEDDVKDHGKRIAAVETGRPITGPHATVTK